MYYYSFVVLSPYYPYRVHVINLLPSLQSTTRTSTHACRAEIGGTRLPAMRIRLSNATLSPAMRRSSLYSVAWSQRQAAAQALTEFWAAAKRLFDGTEYMYIYYMVYGVSGGGSASATLYWPS